jgi:hypothetical protein
MTTSTGEKGAHLSKLFLFAIITLVLLLLPGCSGRKNADEETQVESPSSGPYIPKGVNRRGIHNQDVLAAISRVPRHKFVPETETDDAYEDTALPIGMGQTISQPFIVALMTQEAKVGKGSKVLEIGTGSGYQAAVLSELGAEVFSIEIVETLASEARERLSSLGYKNIHVKMSGDSERLLVVEKQGETFLTEDKGAVRFVPLTGEARSR